MHFRRVLFLSAAIALTTACSKTEPIVLSGPVSDSSVTNSSSAANSPGAESADSGDGRYIARCTTEADGDGTPGQTFFTDGSIGVTDYCLRRYYIGVQPAPGAVYVPDDAASADSAETPRRGNSSRPSAPQIPQNDGDVMAMGQQPQDNLGANTGQQTDPGTPGEGTQPENGAPGADRADSRDQTTRPGQTGQPGQPGAEDTPPGTGTNNNGETRTTTPAVPLPDNTPIPGTGEGQPLPPGVGGQQPVEPGTSGTAPAPGEGAAPAPQPGSGGSVLPPLSSETVLPPLSSSTSGASAPNGTQTRAAQTTAAPSPAGTAESRDNPAAPEVGGVPGVSAITAP